MQTTRYSLSSVGARSSDAGRARTEKARQAWRERFEQQVDPDRTLDPATRARLADEARRGWMRLLARRSTQVRQAARRARLERERVEQQAAEQDRCPHTWPDRIHYRHTSCLDCGLAYGEWNDQLGGAS